MTEYNLLVSSHQDDSDITIINSSITDGDHHEYVDNTQITNSQSIVTSSNNNNNNAHDFIFVDHNPQENAKQLEQVLNHYIRDLKQENKSQLECSQQLIIRLMDIIRPAYPNDQKKMIELDQTMRQIASLHDKRHIENEEKIQQLRTDICQLNKMLCSTKDELSNYHDNPRSLSIMPSMQQQQRHSIHDYNQWTEIEDDAKKLHQLVQTQKNQINEIVTLISESATASNSLNLPDIPENNSQASTIDNQTPPPSDNTFISTLLKKIHDITGQHTPQQPVPTTTTTTTLRETILENHSPGASPSQSLANLTLTSLNPIEEPHDTQIHIEEPQQTVDMPITPDNEKETKACPVCDHKFPPTIDDVQMYDHIESCLFPSTSKVEEPKEYECPECTRKWPNNDEIGYLQHLSDCFNRDI
ncbi:hypothetical protein I4U23_019095 [Adineta vaga]|nr:hypothetical protein I4U23_019095 [Adineta vaga]